MDGGAPPFQHRGRRGRHGRAPGGCAGRGARRAAALLYPALRQWAARRTNRPGASAQNRSQQ
eukprot:6595926-Lingulodinium_polyedra.AAC.1